MTSTIAVLFAVLMSGLQAADRPGILGRWDLTVRGARGDRPSWLEVRHSGVQTLVGQFVGTGGSARPIARVDFKNGELRFAIPPQWERVDGDLVVVGRLEGDRLKGTMTLAGGEPMEWTGVRAPSLRRTAEPKWGKPIALLNGRDLTGWHVNGANSWEVAGGELRNTKSGGNLVTDRTFDDFKLHVDFRVPKGGNSGVYLRGRYEVQIADSSVDDATSLGALGAVYGFLAPNAAAGKPAGEWQSLDVTLVGRLVTVVLNGKTIICNQEIPGITGGALDSKEGEPGPIYLQGDHTAVDYRNIVLTPGTD